MWKDLQEFQQRIGPADQLHACNCVGPKNGDPVCPCRMRGLREIDGRWVEIIDHGPVRK